MFFKKKQPAETIVHNEIEKTEETKPPLAFDSRTATLQDVIFSSNTEIPVKISYRPKGDNEKNFSIELYIAADLKNKYDPARVDMGDWFEVADVKKGLDGFYDNYPYDSDIEEYDRSLEITDIGNHYARQYLKKLINSLEEYNDLYYTGLVTYATAYYYGERPVEIPKSYIQEQLTFYDPDEPFSTSSYYVVFKDLSSKIGNGGSDRLWLDNTSQKTQNHLEELR